MFVSCSQMTEEYNAAVKQHANEVGCINACRWMQTIASSLSNRSVMIYASNSKVRLALF